MKLHCLTIAGFRRIRQTTVYFSDATFLIGENNVGKTTILEAIDKLLKPSNSIEQGDFFKPDENSCVSELSFEAEFINIPREAENWRGFKGRVIKKNINGRDTLAIHYRKRYTLDNNKVEGPKIEMLEYKRKIREDILSCRKVQDLLDQGLSEDAITEVFGSVTGDKVIDGRNRDKLLLIDEACDFDLDEPSWVLNPGGIPQNVLSKLPRYLLIPAEHHLGAINDKAGVLQKTLMDFFEDIRSDSENYNKAKEYLEKLALELDPTDEESNFGIMVKEINHFVGSVFTDTKLHIKADLSKPETLKPNFDIEMSSNIKTRPNRQGLGSIRSATFSLLRYRERFDERRRQKGEYIRPLIIGFEEPEIYLHPNAASLMRDKIYDLSTTEESQIICSTHSPYMIDLSRDLDKEIFPRQILNLIKLVEIDGVPTPIVNPFNITDSYESLVTDEKDLLKLVLKFDDNVSRVFFAPRTIIIEGDTEEVVFKETLVRIVPIIRNKILCDFQIIKARGKATIIPLIKYLKAMGFTPFVIHDKDTGVEGAEKFNQPISNALGDDSKLLVLESCIEDVLGYKASTSDKPYRAYRFIQENWGETWNEVGDQWRIIVENKIFQEYFTNN